MKYKTLSGAATHISRVTETLIYTHSFRLRSCIKLRTRTRFEHMLLMWLKDWNHWNTVSPAHETKSGVALPCSGCSRRRTGSGFISAKSTSASTAWRRPVDRFVRAAAAAALPSVVAAAVSVDAAAVLKQYGCCVPSGIGSLLAASGWVRHVRVVEDRATDRTKISYILDASSVLDHIERVDEDRQMVCGLLSPFSSNCHRTRRRGSDICKLQPSTQRDVLSWFDAE